MPEDSLFLSVLVTGEIRKGIERLRPKEPKRAAALQTWLEAVRAAFGDRILTIEDAVADEWGRMAARRPVSTVDALLAATAKVHRLTLVSRNTGDLEGLGVRLLNPFEPQGKGR